MERALAELGELGWPKVMLIGLALLAAYYFGAFDDGTRLGTRIRQERERFNEAEQVMRRTKAAFSDADRYQREVESMIEQYKQIVSFMPEKMNAAELTSTIGDLAAQSNVVLKSTSPGTAVAKSSTNNKREIFETLRIAFSVEAPYSQILSFLSNVSRVPRILTFDKLELTMTDRMQGESPILVMNATLVGYRYVKPAETPPQQQPAAGGANVPKN